MKKIVLFLVLILMMFTISAKKNTGSYHIKCYKCNDVHGCPGCNAWRMYSEESSDKTIEDHKVMVYHCAHGHVLYLSKDSDDRW